MSNPLPPRLVRHTTLLAVALLYLTACSSNPDASQDAPSGVGTEAARQKDAELARQQADALRLHLHQKMAQQRWLPRSREWEVLAQSAASSRNEMTLFYTRRTVRQDQRASGADQAEPDYWNREHLWPRSFGLKATPADRDLHNLVPADRTVNSSRGNKMFGMATQPHRECSQCRVGPTTWEPPDEVKGDIARVLFYMDVRYEGDTGLPADAGLPDLVLAADADSAGNQLGPLPTLLDWHCADPVSSEERRRHEVIATVQGNRNVFVDSPSLAEIVYQHPCDRR